jgi:C4-type Zn-finger protein
MLFTILTLGLIIVGILLLWFGYRFIFSSRGREAALGTAGGDAGGPKHHCPVCQSELKNGERIKSMTFFPRSAKRIITISGCPYCINGDRRRRCPVCGHNLSAEESLSAKMTTTPTGSQVHIFGCPHCLNRRRLP